MEFKVCSTMEGARWSSFGSFAAKYRISLIDDCTPHDRTPVDSSHDVPDVEPRVADAGLSRESAFSSKRLAQVIFPIVAEVIAF